MNTCHSQRSIIATRCLGGVAIGWSSAVLSILLATQVCRAQTTIDFEAYANNTVINGQYAGVTLSTAGNSCSGAPVIQPVIVTPAGGTSSGARALSIQTGCPDFSPDRLVALFDDFHAEVTFNLGSYPGTYEVKAYDVANGGIAVITQSITIPGPAIAGVHRFVRLQRLTDEDIRRVEIRETSGGFEYIDDLTFDCIDSTVPTAVISTPAPLACVCNSSIVQGTAMDADGDTANWRLERKAPDAVSWTLIATSTTEVNNSNLATWTTSAPTGWFLLRLTVTNACGLSSNATTLVWMDKSFDSVSVRSPAADAILGGSICVDGTVADHCSGSISLEYRSLPGGSFSPFPVISPPWVANDPLGTWNASASPDGNYEIRVNAADGCGNIGTPVVVPITLDNTPPTAVISSPLNCTFVEGAVAITGMANDAHLANWRLSYTGGNTNTWVEINNGVAPVVNGMLGNWNTAGLPRCPYTLRLRVTDQAVVDCNQPHVTETYVTVSLGRCCDVNRDGNANGLDVQTFINCLIAGALCP